MKNARKTFSKLHYLAMARFFIDDMRRVLSARTKDQRFARNQLSLPLIGANYKACASCGELIMDPMDHNNDCEYWHTEEAADALGRRQAN